MYKDVKANFYTPDRKGDVSVNKTLRLTDICHNAIRQFDVEQRVYQNRVVAAGALVAIVGLAAGIIEGMSKK